MRLRHAAALALVGWYLMVPPMSSGPAGSVGFVNENAPLTDWTQYLAFGSPEMCKAAIRDLRKSVLRDCLVEQKYAGGFARNPNQEAAACSLVAAMARSNCIASDDPRLKP
jgi:hypothetical protein